jgi:hypothetical protein
VTIKSFPDDVLQEMFQIYRVITTDTDTHGDFGDDIHLWDWKKLVQVCRRWRRHVIFASPLSLNLQLLCTRSTRVRELLDIWQAPALPLVLDLDYIHPFGGARYWKNRMDNWIAALEHPDRIRQIRLRSFPGSRLKRSPG